MWNTRMKFASIALFLLCCHVPASATTPAVPQAKKLADNEVVTLSALTVTYAAPDFFYVEEDSRCSGIRVECASHGLEVGMRADVSGTMQTNENTERYILAASSARTPEPNDSGVIAPIGMNSSAVGGAVWSVAGMSGQGGVTGSQSLNNVGLLVTTWGRYEQIDAATFTVNSGSGAALRCTAPSGTFLNPEWQYVTVTGISSIIKVSDSIRIPHLLVREIRVRQPGESITVPGTPTGNTSPLLHVSVEYSTTGAVCSHGHTVEYSFDWGDGTESTWSTSTTASRSWSTCGEKTVTVRARCRTNPDLSSTSSALTVSPNSPYTGQMIFIPAGSFLMGSPGVGGNENPQHSVDLPGYYIGKYEVTRGEYRQFMLAGGYSNPAYWSSEGWTWKGNRTEPDFWEATQTWSPGHTFTQTDNHPVVGVSYHEAEAFCTWAGGNLPTEAQWEKAARWNGTSSNTYPWGNTWDKQKCNNYYDTNPAGGGEARYQTAPVGSYPAGVSPYGCHDMAGNVWEWCQDWYKAYPGAIYPFDYTDRYRVMRGGGWNSAYTGYLRCAYRDYYSPGGSLAYGSCGFRFAR